MTGAGTGAGAGAGGAGRGRGAGAGTGSGAGTGGPARLFFSLLMAAAFRAACSADVFASFPLGPALNVRRSE